MGTMALPVTAEQAAGVLLAIQAGDAVACAIPLGVIQRDLERLGCPPWLQRTIPVVKGASVAGLLVGRQHPWFGRLTADALVAYFACALGAHARVRDAAWRWVPAAGMLGLSLVVRRAYTPTEVIDLTDLAEPDVIDVTSPGGDRSGRVESGAPVPTSDVLTD